LTTDIFGTFREENAGHLNWKTKLVEITVYIRSVFAQRVCGFTGSLMRHRTRMGVNSL